MWSDGCFGEIALAAMQRRAQGRQESMLEGSLEAFLSLGWGGAGGLDQPSVVVAGSSWIPGMFGSRSQRGLLMGSLWGAEEIAELGMPPGFLA